MTNFLKGACLVILLSFSFQLQAQLVLETTNVESILYQGEGDGNKLIVGLGGSEGGNAWASDYWKEQREQFLEKGYSFLALGYFGAKGTPAILDQIRIEDVYAAIRLAADQVKAEHIILLGGSRGADLALFLGSYYSDISAVVSIVGSNAAFPGHTNHFTSSCWTYQGEQLPFVPVNDAAVPFLMEGDLRGTFEAMLQDSVAVEASAIQVENIQGPILFMSAREDEICPSTPMANSMLKRLERHEFKYQYEHKVYEGSHNAPLKHFDYVLAFLDQHFPRS